MDLLIFKTSKNMYYNIKADINSRKYACSGVAILDAILNNSKRSMMLAGHHSYSDSTLLPLPKSAITWFGGIFARLWEKCLLGCWTTTQRNSTEQPWEFFEGAVIMLSSSTSCLVYYIANRLRSVVSQRLITQRRRVASLRVVKSTTCCMFPARHLLLPLA